MWKDIPGYDDYKISHDGEIVSKERMVFQPGNNVYVKRREMLIKQGKSRDGYNTVRLVGEHKTSTLRVHRLVALTYINNEENKPEVNHKNGIKTDNSVANLEWVTRGENIRHAVRTGLKKPSCGEKNGNSKLSVSSVNEIYNMRSLGFSQSVIADKIGVSQSSVSNVLIGKCWNGVGASV